MSAAAEEQAAAQPQQDQQDQQSSAQPDAAGDQDTRSRYWNFVPDARVMNTLGDRLKALEASTTAIRFAPTEHFCIRLDGSSFHALTKGFQKPFDDRFIDAMMWTARDLLEKYNAATLAYVESDEITLLFPAVKSSAAEEEEEEGDAAKKVAPADRSAAKRRKKEDAQVHPFDGRLFKLLSTTASFAAARFNRHLESVLSLPPPSPSAVDVDAEGVNAEFVEVPGELRRKRRTDYPPLPASTLAKALSHSAMFDSRAFAVPDAETLADCVYWRSAHDCVRNAVNGLAQTQFPHKRLQKVSLVKVMDMLEREKGIDPLTYLPPRALYGTFIKRRRFQLPSEWCVNPATGRPTESPVFRNRIKCAAINWRDWSPRERAAFATARFWPPEDVPGEHVIEITRPVVF